MHRPDQFFNMPSRHRGMPISSPLRQARERGYLDGWADGYQEAMEQFCSKRRLMGEAALSVVAMLAVTLLLASRWGAF